jgi:hypothetical protein
MNLESTDEKAGLPLTKSVSSNKNEKSHFLAGINSKKREFFG